MIDHVTLGIKGEEAVIVRRRKELGWNRQYSEETAELSEHAYAWFGPLKIEYKGPRFAKISGSLHKLWNHLRGNGYVNWDQFGYQDLVWTIDRLVDAIGLSCSHLIIQSIEFGLNLESPPFHVSEAIKSIVLYKNRPFAKWPSGMGRTVEYSQFLIKIYDKALQSELNKTLNTTRQILRVEIRVKKMVFLKKHRIRTLEDLKIHNRLNSLMDLLFEILNRLTIVEPSVEVSAMPEVSEKLFWEKATYLDFWEKLAPANVKPNKLKLQRAINQFGKKDVSNALLIEFHKALNINLNIHFLPLR